MDMNEKAGQPSMEEILASIRRIIAEEPVEPLTKEAAAANGGRAAIEEGSEFELPSMFRPSTTPEKATTTFGRLTDALHSAATSIDVGGSRGEAAASGPGSLSGLSSLKPIRPEAPAPEPAAPEPSLNAAFPGVAATPVGNVKRVMAPFKDTRFARMSDSASVVAPPPPEPPAAPAPQVAAPPIAPEPMLSPPIPAFFSGSVPSAALSPPPLAPAQGGPQDGSIEDTTAELLRPMLRQWLSENMPRMVEKALHIEVAESVKVGKKPPLPL